jgi:hypothetical protein
MTVSEDFEPEEDLDLILLADTANGFNSLIHKGMLWTVHHRWPQLARFTFNCYHHNTRTIVRVPGQANMILMRREEVIQGNLLVMALCGIALLSLIEHLHTEYPDVLQPCYADNGAMYGSGYHDDPCFKELAHMGSMFRYYPGVSKSIGICTLANQPCLKATFLAMDLPVAWKHISC